MGQQEGLKWAKGRVGKEVSFHGRKRGKVQVRKRGKVKGGIKPGGQGLAKRKD